MSYIPITEISIDKDEWIQSSIRARYFFFFLAHFIVAFINTIFIPFNIKRHFGAREASRSQVPVAPPHAPASGLGVKHL